MAVLRSLDCDHFQVLHRVEGGADARIWKAVAGDTVAALRVFRPHQALGLKFEIEAMIMASAAGVPVPKIFATGSHNNLPCMLIEWIDGQSMLEACYRESHLEPLSRSFGQLSAQLHNRTARPDGTCLIHMDYHPLNAIAKKGKIVGIIDWTNAQFGSPLQDVARTVSLLVCTPLVSREDRNFARTLRRIARHYLNGYGDVGGLRSHILEATKHLEEELEYHIRENGMVAPVHARRIIARWKKFNS